jgi:hypothetical protein
MERPLRSECITMLTSALRSVQNEMPHAAKDMASSAYGAKASYKYASLQSIIDAARPHLLKAGLTLLHSIDDDMVIAVLNHIQSNQYIEARYKIVYNLGCPRSKSAGITFAMKDTYRMLLGMVADDDTDGYLPD